MKMTQSSNLKKLMQLDSQIKASSTANNILYNTGHSAIYFPVNQRAFDGDWDALAIGEYGFDGWLKFSDTHKAQIIELGDFENIDYALSYDDINIATIAPPDGVNEPWLIAVPFGADKIDLRPSNGFGFWQAEVRQIKLDKSQRNYWTFRAINSTVRAVSIAGSVATVARQTSIFFPVTMRVSPTILEVNITEYSRGLNAIVTESMWSANWDVVSTGNYSGVASLTADASLSISDVEINITMIGV